MTELIPEVIDINNISNDVLNISTKSTNPKINFGGGIELLMNEKRTSNKTPTSDIDIEDISKLESELNDLSDDIKPIMTNEVNRSDIFKPEFSVNNPYNEENTSKTIPLTNNEEKLKVNFENVDNINKEKKDKTWDGFNSFNNIPNPDIPATPKISREELLKEKFKFLRKLEALEKKGINLTKKYSMDSSLDEMQGEYEMIMSEKEKSNSMKFQGRMTNTMFKSSMPGMDDIMKQNPELMKQFTQAAANSMSDNSPGFGGFMSNFMGRDDETPPNTGNPPPPIETQINKSQKPIMPNNKPSMNFMRNEGMSIENQFGDVTRERLASQTNRPEMKGPQDLTSILSGLKSKNVNIQEKDDSTISIKDLKEMNSQNPSSRGKRKQKSDKNNTISLEM